MFKLFKSKFFTAIFLMFFVFFIGVVGFMLLSDYGLVDAIYMTIITVTTVGFSEVNPLDQPSKVFTIFLIITSVFVFAYSLSVITEYIVSKNTVEQLRTRRVKKKIDALNGHVIVCGYGRNGKQAASRLRAYRKPFVVIEKKKELIERYSSEVLFVEGNANEDEVLIEAGIERAESLIVALPNDADNLFVVLSARQINKKLVIISRASEESSQKKLKLAGADNVIMPDMIGGDHMASLLVVPDLAEFLDNLSLEVDDSANLEEVAIEDLPEKYLNRSIRDLDLRKTTGCTVIGFKGTDGKYLINPEAETKLIPQSKLIVLGRPEQINKLNALFNI